MKKLTKRLLTVTLTAILTLGCIGIPSAKTLPKLPEEVKTEVSKQQPVYTIMDNFAYRLNDPFVESPDTFEAWVKMPHLSLGGTIMSNFYIENYNYKGTATWAADAIGRIKLYWDNRNFIHVFDNTPINDNQWHHIALVRDPELHTFTLYIDGVMEDSVTSKQRDIPNAEFAMSIGTDYQTFYTTKEPFEGYVRQVTVYTGAISHERVLQDMQTAEITDDYNGQIIGNWYFGEEWTERNIQDTTANGNHAKLHTFDKYVEDTTKEYKYDYMFVEIPDIQTCVRYHYDTFTNMMQWLADNGKRLKVEWASFLGDLSDVGTWEYLYEDASKGMSLLDGRVNYNFVPGNHDYDDNCSKTRDQVFFNRHFPYEKHSKMPGFMGAYEVGSMANTYYTYEVCGVKYLIINLEFGPRLSVLRWAGRLCEQFPEHRVIINTHNYVTATGEIADGNHSSSATNYGWKVNAEPTSPDVMFHNLVKLYPNIFMVFSGHLSQDDAIMRKDTGIHGNTITSWLLDTQTAVHDNGVGEDVMFMIKVNEKTKKMCGYYYSPANDGVYNIQNQFEFSFVDPLNPTVGA